MANHVHGTGHASKQEGLDQALENAWEDAKKNGGKAGTYIVERIELDCDNPIRTYTAIIVST